MRASNGLLLNLKQRGFCSSSAIRQIQRTRARETKKPFALPFAIAAPMPTSDLHLSSSVSMAKTGSSTPCSKLPSSDSRRKALADLPGNGSPVCGLIPPLSGSETPSNLKSALKSSRAVSALPENSIDFSSTPLGENLLRSQVQLLLQKVEPHVATNRQTPSLRSLCLVHNFSESPGLRLLAPTPLNTPCGASPSPECLPQSDSLCCGALEVQRDASSDDAIQTVSYPREGDVQDSGVKIFVNGCESLSTTDGECGLQEPYIKIAESVNSGNDHHVVQLTPLIEDQDETTSAGVVLGKTTTRILQFCSPEKASVTETFRSPFMEGGLHSFSHEPEDDEVSEWSVLVNVSSPLGKEDLLHQSAETDVSTKFVSSIDEHLKKNHRSQEDEDKVDFLWSHRRKVLQHNVRSEELRDAEQDSYEEFSDDADEAWEDYDAYESTDQRDLCDCFTHMTMEGEGERKPLPRGEGKHIRFVYEGDDDSEFKEVVAEIETNEDQISSTGMRLKGLPAPAGKHIRFCEDDADGLES